MKKILIATTNKAKLEELKLGLKELENLGIKILTLNDVRVEKKPKESGKTFCENAQIKARFYGDLTKIPTIADDGGLIIPSLNNEPGVKSRRWLGYEASDKELIAYTLDRLKNKIKRYRVAYLKTCLCFYLPREVAIRQAQNDKYDNEIIFCVQEKIKGYIAQKPSGRPTEGYPFRAIFIIDKFKKYYDELTEEEHRRINHRLKALKKLVPKIKIYFGLTDKKQSP